MTMQGADYLAQLRALTPPGRALCAESGTPFGALLDMTAEELARVDGRGVALREEADPRTATTLLPDWERAFGLPDECSGDNPLLAARRAALLARVTERRNPTPANFVALAAALGVDATITEHRPTTCEMSCEAPVNGEDWAHVWSITSPDRVIYEATCEDTCESPLRVWSTFPHECAVRRAAPAHTVPLFGTYQSEWDFTGGLPAGASLFRPSLATRRDSRGKLAEATIDAARDDYDPALPYNELPYSWADGGDSPPTPPIGWTPNIAGGVVPVYLGRSVRNGMPAARWRLQGTSVGGSWPTLRVAPYTTVPTVSGETRALEVHFEVVRVGGTNTATDIHLAMSGTGAAGNSMVEFTRSVIPAGWTFASGPLRRSRTMGNAGTAFAEIFFQFAQVPGTVWDMDVDVGFPLLVRGAAYLTDTVPVADLARRINGVPQYGRRGLLVEPATTARGTNARVEGGIVGTRLPDGWAVVGGAGVTASLAATGIEDGAAYADLTIAGTPTADGTMHLYWPGIAECAVTPGSVVSAGVLGRLVGGSLAGVASMRPAIHQRDGGALAMPALPVLYGATVVPTSAPLRGQLHAIEGAVLTAPGVATATAGLSWDVTSGVAINTTLRIALPQMQDGARLTSAILPVAGGTGAAPPDIVFVGGRTEFWTNSGGAGLLPISLTGLTGGVGTEPAAGDLVVVSYVRRRFGGPSMMTAPVYDGGGYPYTEIAAFQTVQSSGNETEMHVAWRVMGAVPDSVAYVSWANISGYDGAGVIIRVYRNVDQTTPIDGIVTASGTAVSSIDPPALTPTQAGARVVVLGVFASASGAGSGETWAFSPVPADLVNFQQQFAELSPINRDMLAGGGDAVWPGGSFDPAAWPVVIDTGPSFTCSATFALRRAGTRSAGPGATRARDDLRLAVPAGTYEIAAVGTTVNPAGVTYAGGLGVADHANGLHVVWPPAAIAAGERHLQSLKIRKVT